MASLRTTNQSQAPKSQGHGHRERASGPHITSALPPISDAAEPVLETQSVSPSVVTPSPSESLHTADAEAQAAQALLQAQTAQALLQTQADYDRTCRDEYARYTSHLWEQRRDSQSHADNLVLTLSSAFLALSAGILKSVVSVDHLVFLPLLYWSWVGFGSAIIGTLVSYHLSKKSLDEHIDKCDDYFFTPNQKAFQGVNDSKRNTETCNTVSSTAFVVGLAFTLVFVGTNIQTEKNRMTQKATTVHMVDEHAPQGNTVPFGATAPKPPALPRQPSATSVPSVAPSQPVPKENTK